jgi:hypothetical protein
MTKLINQFDIKYNMVKRLGRKQIEVINSIPYSEIIFLIASGENYPQAVAEKRKKEISPTAKQMNELKEKGFLISINEKEKKNFPQNKKYFSVNWKKIIEEFIRYVNENIDYVCSENERLKLNLKNTIKGFEERVKQAKDKKFQEDLKKNNYLQTFFHNYYSEIGKLKENWTISSTFDFLSFFGDLNFIYAWGSSHDFYNIEKVLLYILTQSESSFPEWLIKENKPKNEQEEFERDKKIHKHTTTEFKELENKRKEQLNKILGDNKEVVELYILDRILQVIKIKPSLQLGLNNATRQTGKEIFKRAISKEQIKKYAELKNKYNLFNSIQEQEQLQKDLKEIIGENGFKVTKPTENKHNKSGNTNKNMASSSESKKGESSK